MAMRRYSRITAILKNNIFRNIMLLAISTLKIIIVIAAFQMQWKVIKNNNDVSTEKMIMQSTILSG